MNKPEDRLLKLAAQVSDGDTVDWERLEEETGQDHLPLVRALRAIAEIEGVHRQLQAGGGDRAEDLEGLKGQQEGCPRWGHLELIERVGQGSFGEVYRARDTRLDHIVALKLIQPRGKKEQQRAQSVFREAQLLARCRHKNVVTVHGADQRDERVGIWMEFIQGRTLSELVLKQGPLGSREAALIGIDLCRALAAVHAQGVLHRDVKAQNVMREEGGRIVLMDLGTGCESDLASEPEELSGTPLYLAPEVLEGGPPTAASDIYSLGILLFFLVTASFPVQGRSLQELRRALQGEGRKLLRDVRPNLSEEFIQVVERAIDLSPQGRFATAGQMEQALAEVLQASSGRAARPDGQTSLSLRPTSRISAMHVRKWFTGVALLAVVAIGWWSLNSGSRLARELYERAIAAQDQGRLDDSVALLEQALEAAAGFAPARARLAMAYSAIGFPQEALDYSDQAYLQRNGFDDQDRHYISGHFHYLRGRYQRAADEYRKLTVRDPPQGDALRYMAQALNYAGQTAPASQAAETALKLDPQDHNTRGLLIELYLDQSRIEDARRALHEAGQGQDQSYHDYFEGLIHLADGNLDAARQSLLAIERSGSTDYLNFTRRHLAQIMILKGQYGAAVESLKRYVRTAFRAQEESTQSWLGYLLARSYIMLGDAQRALEQLKYVERLSRVPRNLTRFRDAALVCLDLNRQDKFRDIRSWIRELHQHYESNLSKGILAQLEGEYDQRNGNPEWAEARLKEAVDFLGDPSTLWSLGEHYVLVEQFQEAEHSFAEIRSKRWWTLRQEFGGYWVEVEGKAPIRPGS